ncbi:MAG: YbjN domain-containing protein [Alphaproteobacteria bacterium]
MDTDTEFFTETPNPLDSVEEMMASNNWIFSRMDNDELVVQVSGKSCEYRLFFIWQAHLNAVEFCCQYDLNITSHAAEVSVALRNVNENIWMGHFDIPYDTGMPVFRHTCLFRGVSRSAESDHIEDIVDVALTQCERYYPLFSFLAQSNFMDTQSLSLVLMETAGES